MYICRYFKRWTVPELRRRGVPLYNNILLEHENNTLIIRVNIKSFIQICHVPLCVDVVTKTTRIYC